MIQRFFGWLQKAFSKTANVMILLGVVILFIGANNALAQYRINHAVIDMVDGSPQRSNSDSGFAYAPALTPTRTPFQPSTPTPFQPRDGYKEPDLSGAEKLAGIAGVPPAASPAISTKAPRTRMGLAPDRLIIPAIALDAPILPIHYKTVLYENRILDQWLVPNTFAAGWHDTSSLLGLPGNTVLNGHHNAYGQVFRDLIVLEQGDVILVYAGDNVFTYRVGAKMLFQERFIPVEERISNAAWILPSEDTRLTLITCWPPDSNTARVVIVAFPIDQ